MATSLSNPYGPDKSSEEAKYIAVEPSTAVDSADTTNKLDGTTKKDSNGETDFLAYVAQAEDISREYQHRNVERALTRSYRAFRNEHYEGSKYLSNSYKGRTRLFVPKTRSSVRKNMAAAAASLFGTQDAVSINATYHDDPIQRATAESLKANLNYRTTRSSKKSGFPWFQICMGAHLDGQLTGVSCSKQYWEYEEVETGETETKQGVDPETQELFEFDEPVKRVIKDRPMVDLVPIENIMMDPAAPWYDPVQGGSWFCARYAMHMDDVRVMLKNKGPKDAWIEDVSDELLLKGRIDEDRSTSRRSREGGDDRYEEFRQSGGWTTVWINENFMRIDGIDYHFWSVGRHGMLSEVRQVYESYPALHGERPYVFGVSQIESHKVFPMAPAEAWQPLQTEINDITNLRIDTLKRSIAPLAVVKRGKNVDITQVQRRGRPDAVVHVDNDDDFRIEKTPGPSGASYTETSVANANFDELAGSFSTSSVQQSRQLNETVGGMKLMSGSANAVTEFDLRVWSESYIEPVFRQLVNLITYYESDEKMMALAGEKAQTRARYGYDPKIDDLLEAEVMVTISAGIGALDPMQQIGKFKAALEMLAPLQPIFEKQGIAPQSEEIIKEVMGNAGYNDGMRFFSTGNPPPPPEQAAEGKQGPSPQELALKEKELGLKERDLQLKEQKFTEDNQVKLELQRMGDDTAKEIKTMGLAGEGEKIEMQDRALTGQKERDHEFGMENKEVDHQLGIEGKKADHELGKEVAERQHVQAKESAKEAHGHAKEMQAMQPTPLSSGKSDSKGKPSTGAAPKSNTSSDVSTGSDATVMAGVNGQLEKILTQNQASISQNNKMIAEALNALTGIAKQMAKPKKVVRDASGKVLGVE